MSGVFNPNEPGISATDDPEVARVHGLEFDDAAGRYIRPAQPSDASGRDGDEAHERQRRAAIAEGEAQQQAADEARQREAGAQEERRLRDEDQADHDARAAGLAPDEQPAAEESGTAEPVIEHDGANGQDEQPSESETGAAGRRATKSTKSK